MYDSMLNADVTTDKTIFRMADVYDTIPFDNPDGGPWKQGWVVTYDRAKITDPKKKLKVIVMPHTHCDPGREDGFSHSLSDSPSST